MYFFEFLRKEILREIYLSYKEVDFGKEDLMLNRRLKRRCCWDVFTMSKTVQK